MTTISNNAKGIALITGGSRGLGKSAALHLANAGWDLVITYNQRASDADDTVKAINGCGRKAVALQLNTGDVTTFKAFTSTFKETLQTTFGRDTFDALVNNAGNSSNVPFLETTEQQFDELMNVHLKGVFFLTQALVPVLADHSRILNVSSGLARFCTPGKTAYATMKGGLKS